MKKIILFLSCILLSNSSFAKPTESKKETKKNLTVCSQSGFIPFEMKDDSGNWDGFDIDLIKKFSDENDLNLVMVDVSLDGLIPALATKKCDLIASGLTITDERAKAVLFSKPMYTVIVCAASLDTKENRSKFKKFTDIDKEGVKIASQTGSAATLYLKKILDNATLMQFSSENDEVNAVLQKKVDLFVEDNVFISQAEKTLKKKFYVLVSTEKGDLAFAARKDDKALISKLNSFLDKIKKNGEYDKLKKKYF